MSRRSLSQWLITGLLAVDICAILAGSVAGYQIRFRLLDDVAPPRGGYELADYLRALPVALVCWIVALNSLGFYARRRRILDWPGAAGVFKATLVATGLLLAYLFFARPASAARPFEAAPYSRAALGLWMTSTFLAVVLARWAVDRLTHHARRHWGFDMARTLVVGDGEIAGEAIRALQRRPEHGLRVIGLAVSDPKAAPEGSRPPKAPILGDVANLLELVRRHGIEVVVVAKPLLQHEDLQRIMAQFDKDLVEVRFVPDLKELVFAGAAVEDVGGVPFVGFRETPLSGLNALLKRLFDIIVSGLALAVLAAPMLLVAWLIRRSSPGPALYRQSRVGLDGRAFEILKFRSMVEDAEAATGPVMAGEDDPRATPIGRFLRRYRIDELPQLINVLRGEMSLVGPRPERPYFVNQFKESIPRYMARHRVKSGVTGWAQVNGYCGPRGAMDARLRYDNYYVERWSWWLDFLILWRTVKALFRPPGGPAVRQEAGASDAAETSPSPLPPAAPERE